MTVAFLRACGLPDGGYQKDQALVNHTGCG